MKIVIIASRDGDDFVTEDMKVDGEQRLHVAPLCESPEDAIIGRSLVDCQDVAKLMKEAYEAGKRGEFFSIIVQGDDWKVEKP
jgi:hypothetical protein